MSDRGLPIVDGAPACPFVAFEDDRDGRATAPDHRHRCFAEPRPAPRALAHQEAYCLSSAFPVCPTFQDWARREAAAARPSASRPAEVAPEPPVSRPMPPLEREDVHSSAPYRTDDTPQRNQQRDWAAPPPWAAGAGAAGASGIAAGSAAGASAVGAAGGPPIAGDASVGGPSGAVPGGASGSPAPASRSEDATPPEARGLAGSAADRLAGPDPADPLAPAPVRSPYAPPVPSSADASRAAARDPLDDDDAGPDGTAAMSAAGVAAAGAAAAAGGGWTDDLDDTPDWDQQAAAAPAPDRQYAPAPQRQPVRDDRPVPAPNPRDQVSRRQPQDPAELFGPAWEKPRKYEAYPSLKTRVGLPGGAGIGRVGLGALALVVAALALFFVGPLLLGIGGDDNGSGTGGAATEAPSELAEPTASPDPTPVPEPTPQVYVVKKGDTFSKIANRFDVTLEQLIAANPQIKDPDKIAIGDEVIIPVPEAGDDGTVEGESAAP
ncbi:MAG TPA: LysM peptidoglycan-binding domain-containing protein [Candidatus Limnocylindrales bacterium]|nr:LysM peptidoglycan-binding domain-containing protein [Candidatus Limnocylindrales bacterium]